MTNEISFKEHVFSMLYGCISFKASILLIAIKLSVHKCIYSFLQALGFKLFLQICHLETFLCIYTFWLHMCIYGYIFATLYMWQRNICDLNSLLPSFRFLWWKKVHQTWQNTPLTGEPPYWHVLEAIISCSHGFLLCFQRKNTALFKSLSVS